MKKEELPVMPRGRKKADVTLENLLNDVTKDIETTEAALKELKGKKKTLEKQIEERELSQLYSLIKEKNLSISDVRDKLGAE